MEYIDFHRVIFNNKEFINICYTNVYIILRKNKKIKNIFDYVK